MTKPFRLSANYTVLVAREWAGKFIPQRGYGYDQYHKGSIYYWPQRMQEKFRDWLWDKGIRLVRDHKIYYLEFFDESTASFFVLRYLGEET